MRNSSLDSFFYLEFRGRSKRLTNDDSEEKQTANFQEYITEISSWTELPCQKDRVLV